MNHDERRVSFLNDNQEVYFSTENVILLKDWARICDAVYITKGAPVFPNKDILNKIYSHIHVHTHIYVVISKMPNDLCITWASFETQKVPEKKGTRTKIGSERKKHNDQEVTLLNQFTPSYSFLMLETAYLVWSGKMFYTELPI